LISYRKSPKSMNKPRAPTSPSGAPRPHRKPYRSPELVTYGRLHTLTNAQSKGSAEMNPTGNPPFMA
jgi:hypothetical protein